MRRAARGRRASCGLRRRRSVGVISQSVNQSVRKGWIGGRQGGWKWRTGHAANETGIPTQSVTHAGIPTLCAAASFAMRPYTRSIPFGAGVGPGLANGAAMSAFSAGESLDIVARRAPSERHETRVRQDGVEGNRRGAGGGEM